MGITMKNWKRNWKRMLTVALAVMMVATTVDVSTFAVFATEGESTEFCEHHAEHTEECGYTEGAEGFECTHVHGEECYSEEINCIHVHDGNCGYVDGEDTCIHECSEENECITMVENCTHAHDDACGYKEAVEGTPCIYSCDACSNKSIEGMENEEDNDIGEEEEVEESNIITAWSWIDENECIDLETNTLALPGASAGNMASKLDIVSLLPTSITATVNETEETVAITDWKCEEYPEEGAYEGTYTFTVSLPGGYTLEEGVNDLSVKIELGGADLYENGNTPNVEGTGFFATEDMEWNDGMPSVSDSANYSGDSRYTSFAGTVISFVYIENEGDELLGVLWDDILITKDGNDAKSLVSCNTYENVEGIYDICFNECGEYVFEYNNDTITVYVESPQVGFYNSSTPSIETYIRDFNFHDMEDNNTFYVILDAPEGYAASVSFSVNSYEEGEISPEQLGNYISSEVVSEGIYKITVNTETGFDFRVEAVFTNGEEPDWETSAEISVWYSPVVDGLVIKDWIEENPEGNLIVHEDAEFKKEAGATLSGTTLYFAYLENEEDETPETLSLENLTITFEDSDASQYVTMSVNESNSELINLIFEKTGEYIVSYAGSEVVIQVDYPQVGFYNSTTQSDNTYLKEFNFHDMENNVFYAILDASEGYTTTLADENPFSVFSYEEDAEVSSERLEEFISTEEVDEGIYKITVNTQAGFDLNVNAVCTNNTDAADSWPTSMGISVWYSMVVEGLVVKDWIEETPEGNLIVSDQAEFMKETGTSLNGTTLYFAYLEAENDEEPETVLVEDLTITLEGNDASQYVTMSANERNSDLTDLRFKKTGEYTVSYNGSQVIIYVDYPVLGFYRTPELSTEGHIGDVFEYTTGNNDVVYLVVNSGDANITDINVNHRYYDGCIDTEMVSNANGIIIYKISILDELDSKFIIYATCQCAYGEDEPYEEYAEIVLQSTEMTGRKAYTDGEKHLGYTGCYMTEDEYNAGMVFWDNSTPIFWVHADTVQGVIDKLSAVANGEEILYKKVDFAGPDTSDGTGDLEITNTGYIYVTISQIGNIDLQDQYVSSSGNMKGIYFTSGKDSAYSEHDYENGFYIEDCVFNLDNVKARITADGRDVNDVIPQDLQGKSYVSRYKGKAYHVTKVTNGDQHYFTLNNAVKFASGEESKETLLLQYLDLNNKEGIAEMTPFFKYPEMHVNIYCDMKFTGRYEKLSIGFKEGKNYNATITNLLTGESEDVYTVDDLGGAKTKEVSTTFVYDDEGGAIVNENTSVWLYEIDSETVTSGNYDGEVEVKETPEPNAMPELTQAQKDEIEKGKKLTVDVQADEQESENIDNRVDAKVKEAINDSSYAGITYLDLSVSASVEGVENNGEKIKTSITELKAPMEITIDIPEHARKNGRRYKIVRHHVDKHGREYTEVIEGKLSNDGRKITFKTDKYSTYAIAYDGVDDNNNNSGGGSTGENNSGGSATNNNNSSSAGAQMNPGTEVVVVPTETTVDNLNSTMGTLRPVRNAEEEMVEDAVVKVESKEESTVPDHTTEVTPVVNMKLQLAVKEEAMQIIDAIRNNSLGKDVLDEETLANVKEALEKNESIITEILAEKLEESEIDTEIKDAFDEALTEIAEGKEDVSAKIVQFLDLSLLLKTENGQVLGTINKLSKEVTFTFAIPDELKEGKKEFVVLRMHDNEVTVLEAITNDTVSFETDSFSIYALAYMEAPIEEITEEESTVVDVGTADVMEFTQESNSNVTLFVIIGVVVFGVLLLAFYLYKKNQNKEN